MRLRDAYFHKPSSDMLERVGNGAVSIAGRVCDITKFTFQIFHAIRLMLGRRGVTRRIDLWVEIDKAGLRAIPIVCLISFMIGMIMAFVGNMQLKMFGAEIYVAALVAISMIRILGAIMTGIIMAGRTGASYAAEIGTMRVNDEIDALKIMGVSPIQFLIVPRVLALTIAMPILTIIADIVAIFGGMCVAVAIMNVSIIEYWHTTMDWLSFNNFAVGVLHGWLFGWVISIAGCWCGIHTKRTADGVGHATTRAVVAGIVGCIVVTAILTLIFNWLDI